MIFGLVVAEDVFKEVHMLKTDNCVFCGHKAVCWSGSVLAREKYALGYAPRKIIAGKCEKHKEESVPDGLKCDPVFMGTCSSLFGK